MSIISRKICLVGDFGVGKTSLIRRFVDRQFSDKYLSTVGVKISRKLVKAYPKELVNSQDLNLLIWDIEGSNKYKAISPSYFQGAKGGIIVADLTREDTLEHLKDRIEAFLKVNPQSYTILALNKSDLIETEYLDRIQKKYQFENNPMILKTYLTSAKTGVNVDEIFQLLANSII
ncbi:Rab family GTPase [Mastigocoleus testarum]|uniref:GTP-binding protein n=1 Tax=Mastigocoleus testarum BC008 TaxID=371196 RepID=A0A0V7ZPM0_9CYAN|nr:Rab family GTPase [Mastigocoleus testarum]KST66319.1 GTP-binding protein [Mastigocoleus testarum BC008]KST66640.1 GTP-binding protein [Mastigocoleus testarum BC008]